ncbi:MAG TPA: alpha-L-fucosidase [Sedimentisphaerales bacterium]|nr:alpha-L-fucosidase [Sedimentisphaerales bacterium]
MRRQVLTTIAIGIIVPAVVQAQDYLKAQPEALERWKDMRFGMFICWGPVSLTGHEIGWSRGRETPIDEYDNLYKRWNPDKYDADAWVKVAKDMGARYIIFLTKHHDGFCLWDTKQTDYNVMNSPLGRDVTRELADACRKEGIGLFPYYSTCDWHHPDFPGTGQGGRTPRQEHNLDRYTEYLQAQSRELISNYGPLLGIWYDVPQHFDKERGERVIRYVRSLQPSLLVNNRTGAPGDFDTPEQRVGAFSRDRAWESCITLGTQWAWKPDDHLKSYTEAIRMLVVCACGDGNLALNTNPMPDGRIEPRQVESFREIGKWTRKFGESIYKTRGGPFLSPDSSASRSKSARQQFALPGGDWWGGSTHRDNVVYLHILQWPRSTIKLPAIDRKLVSSSLLTGDGADIEQTQRGITISVPENRRDPVDTIVRLEFDKSVADLAPVQCVGFEPTNYRIDEKKQDDASSILEVQGPDGTTAAKYPVRFTPHHYPATDGNDTVIKEWLKLRYGAFLCFNSNQFSGNEFCDTKSPSLYAPPELDVKQWITMFRQAGMNYAVLTVRHTSGFLLWDSATTDFDVASSGNTTNVVKAYVEECRQQGLAPGIYYCLWGGKNCGPSGKKEIPEARALILAQLHELAANYGPIPYFWIDMMNWAPANITTREIYDSLKNISPKTVVIFNQHIQDGSSLKYFPTDVINGEMMPPPAAGHKVMREVDGRKYYLPFEFEPCSQNRAGGPSGIYRNYCWFTYGEGRDFTPSRPFSVGILYRHIKQARDGGANNVLLSCAPDHTGRLRDQDVEQLLMLARVFENPSLLPPAPLSEGCSVTASGVWPNPHLYADLAFDGDMGTRWGGAPNTNSGWLAVDFGEEKTISRLFISEAYERIRKFELQKKDGDNWKTFFKGTTVGEKYNVSFSPVAARHVRLNILEATDVPTIWEVQLFEQ